MDTKKILNFLSFGLWEKDLSQTSRKQALVYRNSQIMACAVEGFVKDKCLLRASALTYATLLSLVPLLALMFAILKGFGVQKRLEPIILERVAAGSHEVVQKIIAYIDRTNVTSLGVLGFITLIISVLLLMSNIERSFNEIWDIPEGRPLLRKITDYSSTFIIIPILILAALSLTTFIQSHSLMQKFIVIGFISHMYVFLIKLIPYFVMWFVFTFVYLFVPNARVSFTSALIGGIIGGSLWQVSQWGYITFQIGVAKYNAIYGTLAQLPVLLVWIYISYLILLFGAEISFAHQNLATYRMKKLMSEDRSLTAFWALRILTAIGKRFHEGKQPYSAQEISRELELSKNVVFSIIEHLCNTNIIAQTDGTEPAYVPKKSLEQITIYEVVSGINRLDLPLPPMKDPFDEKIRTLFKKIDEQTRDALRGITIKELAQKTELDFWHEQREDRI